MKTKILFPFKLITVFAIAILINACTVTTTKPIKAEFNKDIPTLESEIKKIVICDNFDVNGSEINSNNKIAKSLEIKVVNGVNIPKNNDELKTLAHSIGSYIKSSLKDSTEFNIYKVIFITKGGNDVVHTTKTIVQEFKSEEF
jgi:hypothetical protein